MLKVNSYLNNQSLKLDLLFIIGLTESKVSFSVSMHKEDRTKFNRTADSKNMDNKEYLIE